MDKYDLQSLIPDYGDYSPDAIWADSAPAKAEAAPEPAPVKTPAPAPAAEESLAQRSRREALASFGEALRQYQKADDAPVSTPSPTQPQDETVPAAIGVSSQEDSIPQAAPNPETPEKRRPRIIRGADGIITIQYDPPADEEPEDTAPDTSADDTEEPEPSSEEEWERSPAEEPESAEKPFREPYSRHRDEAQESPTFREKLLRPFTLLMATSMARREMRRAEAARWAEPEEEALPPELSPKKAAKFYAAQAKPLRLRCRIAFFLTVILAWVSFQLPMAGLLGKSLQAQAGVSLVLTLAVMITALDVVTIGFRQLMDFKPGAESLAATAALMACVDSALVMAGYGTALPFCAAACASLSAALWGQRLTCTALRRTFTTAAGSKAPTVLVPEEKSGREGGSLLRTPFSGQSIVRRSEQPDLVQNAYTTAAPILMLLSLVLAILASLGGKGDHFLHIFSAFLTISAALSAFFAFPLPYALAAGRLRDTGAAILGWGGFADIGRRRRIVITDEDLFPPGTIKFTAINIQEGAFTSKVISYTASLLAASGSGVFTAFQELLERRNFPLVDVDGYKCHEGGGLSAVIDQERVLVGSASYMTLMGIRLPQNLEARNSICTAIDGELVAVFTMDYIPVSSVQEALVTLLRGRTQAIFAIRDFNITPLMLRQLFRIPTDNLNFPSFRERYRMAGTTAKPEATASAIFTRGGMMPLVDAAETARRLHTACRISTIVSLAGAILGMLILFLLFRAGAYDTATAGNVLAYMLLWALPVIILSIGQSR